MMRIHRSQARRRDERAPSRWRPYIKVMAVLLLVVAPTGVALVQGVRWLTDPATFPVRSVVVEGELRYLDRDELQAAVGLQVGGGLLGVDVEAVRRQVESLAWVRLASVRRVWPEGLIVRVVEQQPLAKWVQGGLVNTDGEVFEAPEGTGPAGLPEFDGPQNLAAVVTRRYREFLPLVRDIDNGIRRIELDERNAWRVLLSGGLVLDLGREDVGRRLARFGRFYASVLAKEPRTVTRVDLRYANGFAVEFGAVPGDPGEKTSSRQRGMHKGDLANAKKV